MAARRSVHREEASEVAARPKAAVLWVALVCAWASAGPAGAADGDYFPPLTDKYPGLGWHVSPDAIDAVHVVPSRRLALGDSSMELNFSTRRGARQGFALYRFRTERREGIPLSDYESLAFYYSGDGSKGSVRLGLVTAPRKDLGEKAPQRFTIDLPLDYPQWQQKALRWEDFWHTDDRRALNTRDVLLMLTVNLAPPPRLPTRVWFDGLRLQKKFEKLGRPEPEPSAVPDLKAVEPDAWANLFGTPTAARDKLIDKKPLNVLVISGPEAYGLELWNLPGKPTDYVFHNVLKQLLTKEFDIEAIQVRVLGNVTDSLRSDGVTLPARLRSASDRASATPPEELAVELAKLEPVPKVDIDELVGMNFDLAIVFFSYLDVGTPPEQYVNALATVVKGARERLDIQEIIVVSPLPYARNVNESSQRASRVRLFCREQELAYADLFGAATRNGYWALRDLMIDERRLSWRGHDVTARILLEMFKKAAD
jgi:hypothetical protein